MADVQGKRIYADIESLRETWTLGAATLPRVAVMQEGRPGVTYSGTPDQTTSLKVGPYTISGIPQGDNGQEKLDSTVSTTGTFEFPIDGLAAGTAGGTKVYFVAGDGSLTLTATDNTFFGVINYPEGYQKNTSVAPVKIGVVN